MLSTTMTEVYALAALVVACVGTLIAIGVTWNVARLKHREIPTKNDVQRLQIDVQDCYGRVEDLSERFTRFQKREGLRVAREEKKSQADLQAEALQLMNQKQEAAGAVSPKADLYKRVRGH